MLHIEKYAQTLNTIRRIPAELLIPLMLLSVLLPIRAASEPALSGTTMRLPCGYVRAESLLVRKLRRPETALRQALIFGSWVGTWE